MPQVNRIKGGALLTALFIMTLVAIVATAMSSKIQLDIYHAKTTIVHDKLYLSSQAVTFWALSKLSNKKNNLMKANPQGIVSTYPQDPGNKENTVRLSGAIYDLQAQYNLNNLSNKKSALGFTNLLSTVIRTTKTEKMQQLAFAINNWLSPYEPAHGQDAYLSYYLKQKPPFYPGHQLMASKTELRLVKNVNASIYLALEPYITALPEVTPINLNTAPIQVLKSLSTIKDDNSFNELISKRKNGLKKIDTVAEILKKLNIANDQITLESSYFLSIAEAVSENLHLTVYTLLKRNRDTKGNTSVKVLSESFNVL